MLTDEYDQALRHLGIVWCLFEDKQTSKSERHLGPQSDFIHKEKHGNRTPFLQLNKEIPLVHVPFMNHKGTFSPKMIKKHQLALSMKYLVSLVNVVLSKTQQEFA